jgi:hypothetical protein
MLLGNHGRMKGEQKSCFSFSLAYLVPILECTLVLLAYRNGCCAAL